jgi:hypothetical protein
MTYKLYKTLDGRDAAMSVGVEPKVSFVFDHDNTDYQAFKTALQTGKNADGTAVSLEDANGTAMTADQITTFLPTLP